MKKVISIFLTVIISISTFFLSLFSFLNLSIISNNLSIQSVSAGGSHTIAMTTNGRVYAWGYNVYGQLGDRTFNNGKFSPLLVIV